MQRYIVLFFLAIAAVCGVFAPDAPAAVAVYVKDAGVAATALAMLLLHPPSFGQADAAVVAGPSVVTPAPESVTPMSLAPAQARPIPPLTQAAAAVGAPTPPNAPSIIVPSGATS